MARLLGIFFILTTIIGLSVSSNSCDVRKFKAVENFKLKTLHGERWSLLRYRNGDERKTICQNNVIRLLPDKTTCLISQSFWPNGTSTFTEPTAVVVDPLINSGKIVCISWEPALDYYIVYEDKNLIFYSSCLDGEEYLYVDCVYQYPSEEIWDTINKTIRKLKLDKSKMTRMCIGEFPMF